MKWYGSVDNRIEEGHNYNEDKLIHVGDDITMYLWSDRLCYFVTKVIDQKHIFVHKYQVCADHSKEGGIGHENWLYFKTVKEKTKYINDCIDKGWIKGCQKDNLDEVIESKDEEWVFRYGKWRQVGRFTKERWGKCLKEAKEKYPYNLDKQQSLARYLFGLGDEEYQKVMDGKDVVKNYNLSGKVSFGVRDYYYDWSF